MTKKTFLYVGNWRGPSMAPTQARPVLGFGTFAFDAASGEVTLIKEDFPNINVGATCVDAKRNLLYCTHEVPTLPGYILGGGGQVHAFAIDPQSGTLTEINHQPSYGTLPSYAAIDASGAYLLVTNHTGRTPVTKTVKDPGGKFRIELDYDESSTVLFPLDAKGAIGDPLDIYKHRNKGHLPTQNHSQMHSVMASPSGDLFATCDKGGDKITFFRIDRAHNALQVCDGGDVKARPGSSPRYSAFHPTRPFFYANHETLPFISAYSYDAAGRLSLIADIDTIPQDISKEADIKQSDIRIHPSGQYLYAASRTTNSISAFAIDQESGKLSFLQHAALDGTGPRGFAISPDGRFMAIAALTSHEVLIWSIARNGQVEPTGRKFKQPNPGNVTFFETPGI